MYGNHPFDVELKKPRESLSKHTEVRPTSWHCDDANYLLLCVNEMPKILEYIEKLEVKLERQREEFNKRREQDEFINDKIFSDLWDENEQLKSQIEELEDWKNK